MEAKDSNGRTALQVHFKPGGHVLALMQDISSAGLLSGSLVGTVASLPFLYDDGYCLTICVDRGHKHKRKFGEQI
jgi:hypothetical protein